MRVRFPNEWRRYTDISATAGSLRKPRLWCQRSCAASTASMKRRKEALPKREPPVSSGGHCDIRRSAESRMCRMVWMMGSRSEEWMAEMEVSRTLSERPNMKERRRV